MALEKKQKIFLYVLGGVILLGTGITIVLTWKKKPETGLGKGGGGDTGGGGQTNGGGGYIGEPPRTLYPLNEKNYGVKDDKVGTLQYYLNKAYNAGLSQDTIWGKNTHNAVRKYLKYSEIKDLNHMNSINLKLVNVKGF